MFYVGSNVHCTFCCVDFGDMTLGQGDTSLGHEQQLCKISSKSNITVVNDGQHKAHGYVCSVILNLDIGP